jgi:hypothetical protein
MSAKLVNVDRNTPMLLAPDLREWLPADHAITVYAAMDKSSHHRGVADLEAKAPPTPPPAGAAMGEIMRYRLKTPEGQRLYRLRKQTVEPVFGIIKQFGGKVEKARRKKNLRPRRFLGSLWGSLRNKNHVRNH